MTCSTSESASDGKDGLLLSVKTHLPLFAIAFVVVILVFVIFRLKPFCKIWGRGQHLKLYCLDSQIRNRTQGGIK